MKKTDYPNLGHLVPDIFVDGIARVYQVGGSVALVLESPTGIETHSSILKNEVVRLIVPMGALKNFHDSIGNVCEAFTANSSAIIPVNQPLQDENQNVTKKNEHLGSAFLVGD